MLFASTKARFYCKSFVFNCDLITSMNYVVVGGGVVGLACARALALRAAPSASILLLEEQAALGQGTSSRNSGVVHSGVYYPTGSAKARLCVRGRRLLYEYVHKCVSLCLSVFCLSY